MCRGEGRCVSVCGCSVCSPLYFNALILPRVSTATAEWRPLLPSKHFEAAGMLRLGKWRTGKNRGEDGK